MGIIRNQYMGRTFIEPTEQIRNMGVRLKAERQPRLD
jgi:glutamine phosphoribosylpyrophosphate amidotransferase